MSSFLHDVQSSLLPAWLQWSTNTHKHSFCTAPGTWPRCWGLLRPIWFMANPTALLFLYSAARSPATTFPACRFTPPPHDSYSASSGPGLLLIPCFYGFLFFYPLSPCTEVLKPFVSFRIATFSTFSVHPPVRPPVPSPDHRNFFSQPQYVDAVTYSAQRFVVNPSPRHSFPPTSHTPPFTTPPTHLTKLVTQFSPFGYRKWFRFLYHLPFDRSNIRSCIGFLTFWLSREHPQEILPILRSFLPRFVNSISPRPLGYASLFLSSTFLPTLFPSLFFFPLLFVRSAS